MSWRQVLCCILSVLLVYAFFAAPLSAAEGVEDDGAETGAVPEQVRSEGETPVPEQGGEPGGTHEPGEGGEPGEVPVPGEGGEPGGTHEPGEGGEPGEVPVPGQDGEPGEVPVPGEGGEPGEVSDPGEEAEPEALPAPEGQPAAEAPVYTPPAEEELPPREVPADDPRFLDRSWEEIIDDFLTEHHLEPDSVGLAYYNTVTGETHIHNGDMPFHAASLYKLPLNMYYAERIYLGEMSMDDTVYGMRYGDMQRSSLQFSANWTSEQLQANLGTVDNYINCILPYMVPEGGEYDIHALRTNRFTAAQMLYTLQTLYADPERYPDVVYYLKLAMPENFFRLWEKRFTIAHKYGWFVDENASIANDVGIVWTDEPILLACLTLDIPGATLAIGDYCVLMSDYSQYWHGVRLAEQAAAAATAAARGQSLAEAAEQAAAGLESRLAEEAAKAKQASLDAARSISTPEEPQPEQPADGGAVWIYLALGGVLLAAALFAAAIAARMKKGAH